MAGRLPDLLCPLSPVRKTFPAIPGAALALLITPGPAIRGGPFGKKESPLDSLFCLTHTVLRCSRQSVGIGD